jgi:Glycosyl hydrolases family 28
MEAYHITIRGPNMGGTDGIDVACADNCYLHHITVTNRDECVCVKSPSQNVLIEDIYCNQSGGMSIGSLTADGLFALLLLYLLRLLSPQGFWWFVVWFVLIWGNRGYKRYSRCGIKYHDAKYLYLSMHANAYD